MLEEELEGEFDYNELKTTSEEQPRVSEQSAKLSKLKIKFLTLSELLILFKVDASYSYSYVLIYEFFRR